jgi:hypothetical protein
VPVDIPDTIPVLPIVAIKGDEELHVPPVVVLVKAVVRPVHTLVVPVIGAGTGLTVSVRVLKQLVGNVYVIIVVPVVAVVSTPEVPMLATVGLLLLHVPLAGISDMKIVEPRHELEPPEIGLGCRFTVTVIDAIQPVGIV